MSKPARRKKKSSAGSDNAPLSGAEAQEEDSRPPVRYKVKLTRNADKALDAMSSQNKQRVLDRMDRLKVDPRNSPNVEPLSGEEDMWRIRCGDYRVVYQIHENLLVVHVITIDHRKQVYRKR